jgi:hypothetical protein
MMTQLGGCRKGRSLPGISSGGLIKLYSDWGERWVDWGVERVARVLELVERLVAGCCLP